MCKFSLQKIAQPHYYTPADHPVRKTVSNKAVTIQFPMIQYIIIYKNWPNTINNTIGLATPQQAAKNNNLPLGPTNFATWIVAT